jgi:hypothetical protein
MSELFLRGSLANITMANLTQDEQTHVSSIVDYVAAHPGMARHRAAIILELGNTIKADYLDDRRAGDAEYKIAVWKATVELFYHRQYTFRCRACGSTTWITQQGVKREIDRQAPKCPNCKQVRVTESGDTNLVEGSYIDMVKFQASYQYFTALQNAPKCESPIDYIPGAKKYTNPNDIINDDDQLVKFFGEFVWNYFRQQLSENPRKEHRKEPQKIYGRADYIITEEILALCQNLKIDYNYSPHVNPSDGSYHINVVGLLTPPEFTAELAVLRKKATQYNIEIRCLSSEIQIVENSLADEIEAKVSKPEHVMVLDNNTKSGDDEDGNDFTINSLSFRTVGAQRMNQDDHVAVIDAIDVMEAVRDSLPDGDCKAIFDIQRGLGDAFDGFWAEYKDDKPKKNHIAKYLGIGVKSVTIHLENIRTICLVHGLIPRNR